MFNVLTSGFLKISDMLRAKKRITKDDIENIIFEMKKTLLDGDLNIRLINKVCDGLENILSDSLIRTKDVQNYVLYGIYKNLSLVFNDIQKNQIQILPNKVNTIALFGMQGSGKTSTNIKLGNYFLKQNPKFKIAAISFDIQRSAAQDQLKLGCEEIGIDFISHAGTTESAGLTLLDVIKNGKYDILLIDTPGKSFLNAEDLEMLKSITDLHQIDYKLLVVDSLIGQISKDLISNLQKVIDLDGCIFTKADSDPKGGAIFNIISEFKKPIFFITEGERPFDISCFNKDVFLKRLLGIGDIKNLKQTIKEAEGHLQQDSITRIATGNINFNDLLMQLNSLKQNSQMKKIASLIPGQVKLKSKMNNLDMSVIGKQIAIIQSMTSIEREIPSILFSDATSEGKSRINRIAKGSMSTPENVINLIQRVAEISQFFAKTKPKK
jgi:signal recognition particle subunit SRP54